MISDCSFGHKDHWRYDNKNLDTFDNDDPCNGPVVDGRYDDGGNDGDDGDDGNEDDEIDIFDVTGIVSIILDD